MSMKKSIKEKTQDFYLMFMESIENGQGNPGSKPWTFGVCEYQLRSLCSVTVRRIKSTTSMSPRKRRGKLRRRKTTTSIVIIYKRIIIVIIWNKISTAII
jgi:hypothetical protein